MNINILGELNMIEKKEDTRSTSVELPLDVKKYFGMKCEKNQQKKSELMNILLERFWSMNPKKINIIRREADNTEKILMAFYLTNTNWAKLNQYVSDQTILGNKILKADVLEYVISQYIRNVGFFGNDI
jgi:hypothetical protein